jgi:hypothetical protein
MGFFDTISDLMNFDKPSKQRKVVSVVKASKPTKVALIKKAAKVTKKVKSVSRPIVVKKVEEKQKPDTKLLKTILVKNKTIKIIAKKMEDEKRKKTKAASKVASYKKDDFGSDGLAYSKKQMVYAPGDRCFWSCDGRVLADLRELGEALAEIEDDVFNHHVNDERHDFADWVEDVLCDGDCAKKLRETKSKHDAKRVVLDALALYDE